MRKLFMCFSVVALTLASLIFGSAVLFAAVDPDEIPGKNKACSTLICYDWKHIAVSLSIGSKTFSSFPSSDS